jgi:ActR/RegA family two-component response regulator
LKAPSTTPRPLALLVEDEDQWIELLGVHLERLGFEVTVARNAAEAIRSSDRLGSPFDAAVIDVRLDTTDLNDASGIELLKAMLRDNRSARNVVVTSAANFTDRTLVESLGAAYLSKGRISEVALREALAGGGEERTGSENDDDPWKRSFTTLRRDLPFAVAGRGSQ